MKTYAPNRKVLFLDDEVNLLKSLGRLASRFGFEPTATSDPQEALSLLGQGTFGVIISDYRMPQMVGTEFLSQTKEKSPNSIRILLTGYADVGAAIQAVNKSHVYKYLTKPWEEEQIRQTLEDAFKQFNLSEENLLLQQQVRQAAVQLKQINKNLEGLVEKRTEEIRQLNWRLESGFLGSIKLMGAVAHRDDPMLAEHARRVAVLSSEVGKEMGWTGRDLLELQIAGYLHDITDSIDQRNPKHGAEAFDLMRMIPNLGKAYEYVRHHHEQMNGKGGPDRLAGDAIPLGARILAVVDAFDEALHLAKTSESAVPNKVLYELKQQCPEVFDGAIVASLHNVLKRLGRLKDEDYETTVSIISLIPGMILSRDLLTRSGKLLLPKDNKITEDYLARIFKRHTEDPVADEIFVYSNSIKEGPKRRVA